MSDPTEIPPEANPAGDTTAGQPPEERIAALEAELSEMRDRWLRSEAEMQNLRTRTQREVADARQYAIQKFAGDVVEAAQNLRRGLDSLPPASTSDDPLLAKLREGFEGVERSFLGVLERNGIERKDPAGQPFDPELHQAMAEQPAPDGVAPGTVIQAWTPAWTLHGRLLKPAMVVVAAKG
jgi:molecular chaperone GrpE